MRLFFIFAFFSIVSHNYAQNKYPNDYFRCPLGSNNSISSNFGEIRPSHFHAGLDYSTQKKSGLEVYAAANGYISRVKVSPTGYGNALYITHPNGFVTVYGHLSQFDDSISKYVYQAQHERQQFEIDDYLYPNKYPVKKGQVIAKSGNTGTSFGAHLHFEIRDQFTEEPINPLLFGLKLPDKEAPSIEGLYMYHFAQGKENYKYIYSQKIKKTKPDTIHAHGKIGFGVEIFDYMTKKKGKKGRDRFGIYEIKLFVDDSLLFFSQIERFAFDETKSINSFVDYDLYRNNGIKVSKCFIEPNNKLKIYKSKGNGLYDFSDGKLHEVRIEGMDVAGNSVKIVFLVKSDSFAKITVPSKDDMVVKEIDCKKTCQFATDSFKIDFPEDALYYNIDLKYSHSKIGTKSYSDYHHIHNQNIPLHNLPIISIKAYDIPDNLKEKAIIVGFGRNQHLFSEGGTWNGDFLETKISNFGTYYISVDTIPPVIIPITLKKSNILKSNHISFEIKDNLAGIDDWVAFIDNKWVLFGYDEKNKSISCDLSTEKISHGRHDLIIWLRDKVGNIGTFESKFIY